MYDQLYENTIEQQTRPLLLQGRGSQQNSLLDVADAHLKKPNVESWNLIVNFTFVLSRNLLLTYNCIVPFLYTISVMNVSLGFLFDKEIKRNWTCRHCQDLSYHVHALIRTPGNWDVKTTSEYDRKLEVIRGGDLTSFKCTRVLALSFEKLDESCHCIEVWTKLLRYNRESA